MIAQIVVIFHILRFVGHRKSLTLRLSPNMSFVLQQNLNNIIVNRFLNYFRYTNIYYIIIIIHDMRIDEVRSLNI